MNICHSAEDATHLFPEHSVNNANYPIEHDILSLSTVKLLIAPEYRCNRALPYGLSSTWNDSVEIIDDDIPGSASPVVSKRM